MLSNLYIENRTVALFHQDRDAIDTATRVRADSARLRADGHEFALKVRASANNLRCMREETTCHSNGAPSRSPARIGSASISLSGPARVSS